MRTCKNCNAEISSEYDNCYVCNTPLEAETVQNNELPPGIPSIPIQPQLTPVMQLLNILAILGIVFGLFNLFSLSLSLSSLRNSIDIIRKYGSILEPSAMSQAKKFEQIANQLATWGYSLGIAGIICNIGAVASFSKKSRFAAYCFLAMLAIGLTDIIVSASIIANMSAIANAGQLPSSSVVGSIIGLVLRGAAAIYLFTPKARAILK